MFIREHLSGEYQMQRLFSVRGIGFDSPHVCVKLKKKKKKKIKHKMYGDI